MARRATAGRDQKIIQGQRRDAFFAKMRRKGGVPRMPSQGASVAAASEVEPEQRELAEASEAEPAAETSDEAEAKPTA